MERTTLRHKYSAGFGPRLSEEKKGLLSGSAEGRQISINLLLMTRAAASVGYTEFPLAFQKDRLSQVPSVLCLSSSLACPHKGQAKNQWLVDPRAGTVIPVPWRDSRGYVAGKIPLKILKEKDLSDALTSTASP
ncbi:hypothetical protein WISP_122207 [Willisornis vidua]|uniref:Uncharacterized protein n=1 Tax=Willisornis vidua TaxID=1566151 RepID=A0ABQ9CS94_9PASS|nr:hypothetical protein WISP_122207 [Willisornis vidua]